MPSYGFGPGWVHELKHDGYRLQIHIRDGRVRLYTMNAADWSDRYPLIVEDATRIKGTAIIDAEVVCAGKNGVPDFDRLHSRCFDHLAVACAFDLLMLNGDDLRGKTFVERKAALRRLLKHEPNGFSTSSKIGTQPEMLRSLPGELRPDKERNAHH